MLKQQRRSTSLLVTAEDLIQEPVSINQSATIYDASEKILSHNISVIIVNAREKFGILSQKDLARTLLEESRHIKNISVSEKMQELVLVDQFAPVSNCASLMLSKRINTLGVKNAHSIKGIMTKHDLVRYFHENIVDETKLADIMSIGCFFVPDTTPLFDALTKMIDNQISRLLVKDGNDKPSGIVTYKSFLTSAIQHSNKARDNIFASSFGKTCKVGEVMKKQLISVSVQTTLAKVAKVMIDYRVHGVAVTENQQIVGFVTQKDIVRQLTRIQT